MISNSQSSTQAGGCIDSDCAPKELRLNVSTLSDPNSLMPSITITSLDMPPVSTLVDSSSSHCFVDSKFVNKHSLETYAITPLELQLLDGSLNTFVTEATKLNIQFSTGKVTSETFFVTLLDSSCVLVLEHSWLTRCNLLIDWVLGHIEFQKGTLQMLAALVPPSVGSTSASASAASHPPDSPPTSDLPSSSTPYISLIGAAAFVHACKLPETIHTFVLRMQSSTLHLPLSLSIPPIFLVCLPLTMTLLMSSAKPRPPCSLHIASMTSASTWKMVQVLCWVCTPSPRLS